MGEPGGLVPRSRKGMTMRKHFCKRMAVLAEALDAFLLAGDYAGAAGWLDAFDANEDVALTLFILDVAGGYNPELVDPARQRVLSRAPQRVLNRAPQRVRDRAPRPASGVGVLYRLSRAAGEASDGT